MRSAGSGRLRSPSLRRTTPPRSAGTSRPASRCPHEKAAELPARRASPSSSAPTCSRISSSPSAPPSGRRRWRARSQPPPTGTESALRRRDVLRPVREACADRARARGDARLRSQLVRRPDARASAGSVRRGSRSPSCSSRCLTASIPERGSRPAAVHQASADRRQRAARQLDGGAVSHPEVGAPRSSEPRRRRCPGAALGRDRPRLPPRRAGSRGSLGDAGGGAGRPRAAAGRCRVRRAPFRRAGHGGRRPLPRRGMADGTRGDRTASCTWPTCPARRCWTTPDPERTEGVVRSTRPLALGDGPIVRGLVVRFEGGRAVEITADEGEEIMRGRAALDQERRGSAKSRSSTGRAASAAERLLDTLLDENAVSHIALGDGDPSLIGEGDRSRVNERDAPRLHDRRRRRGRHRRRAQRRPHPRPPRRRLAALAESLWKAQALDRRTFLPDRLFLGLWMNRHRIGTGSVPGTGHWLLRNAAWQRAPVGRWASATRLLQPAAEAGDEPGKRGLGERRQAVVWARAPRGGSARRR